MESQEFIDFLKRSNLAVEKLMFKADTLTEHIMQMFWERKAKLVAMFRSIKKVCLTCD
jgi:cytochrome c oxidase subunit IV